MAESLQTLGAKTASVSSPQEPSLKTLSGLLRSYEPRPLSYDDLHGVKIAEVGPAPSPLGHVRADKLRATAHGLRKMARAEDEARVGIVRDVHAATRALMLLRRT